MRKHTLEQLENELSKTAQKITKHFAPMSSDETFHVADLFLLCLDYQNNHITKDEKDSEIETMLDKGELPILRKVK
jgi:hypothetical protein